MWPTPISSSLLKGIVGVEGDINNLCSNASSILLKKESFFSSLIDLFFEFVSIYFE